MGLSAPTSTAPQPPAQIFCPYCEGGNPPEGQNCMWCDKPLSGILPMIEMHLIDKGFIPTNYDQGRYNDYISLKVAMTSNFNRAVRAFTGSLTIRDLFDREILSVGITDEEGLLPGKRRTESWTLEYNEFIDEHRILFGKSARDVKVEFSVHQVIFSDGSKQVFN